METLEIVRKFYFRLLLLALLLATWYYVKEVRPRYQVSSRKRKRSYSLINKLADQKRFLSILTELDDESCKNVLRMDRKCFKHFCNLLVNVGGLTESTYAGVVEKVSSFLFIVAHHAKHRVVAMLFGRSRHTISIHFHEVLGAVLRLHEILLAVPEPVTQESEDPVWKYFKGCLGALDGTYVPVDVRKEDHPRYRNRKATLSVNVLGVCDMNMRFVYVLAGWEGSAADGRVLRDAINRPNGLQVPQGNYYLVDCGYANAPGFLAPYRSTRYHLRDWGFGNLTPQTYQEYFNMRHSSARNVIERTFGLLKKRWAILRSPSFYPIDTQNDIILACCLIHNFIRLHMSTDPAEEYPDEDDEDDDNGDDDFTPSEYIEVINNSPEWTNWRNTLAMSMFTQWRAGRTTRR